MAAGIAVAQGETLVAGSPLSILSGLGTLEKQLTYIATLLQAAQNTYNAANPSTPVNHVNVTPNFINNTLTLQLVMVLDPLTVEKKIVDGVQSFI